jgi:hypothetical protein
VGTCYQLFASSELTLGPALGTPTEGPRIAVVPLEESVMTGAFRRWQDWAVVVLGAIVFVTPFVFGQTSNSVASSVAYVLGVLIVLGGLLNAAMARVRGLELIPAILAVILFVSPWVFGFAGVTALAWSAWIVAILIVLAVGSLYTLQGRRATA